jgi:hypothetical protein
MTERKHSERSGELAVISICSSQSAVEECDDLAKFDAFFDCVRHIDLRECRDFNPHYPPIPVLRPEMAEGSGTLRMLISDDERHSRRD